MNNETMHKNNTTVADGLSKKYAPVNTELLLTPFFDKGWTIKKHIKPSGGIGKELLTLTHNDYMYSNGDHLTVECLNSNNGNNALILMGGYGRIACSNGLIIGDVEGGRFIHRGTSIYTRLENQYENIVAHLNRMKQDIVRLQGTTLSNDQVNNAVYNVLKMVFERDTKKYSSMVDVSTYDINRLLRVRRETDRSRDAFTVLNVVQENVIRRGLLGTNVTTINKETQQVERKYTTKSACEQSTNSVALNKIISECFLREVA